MVPWVVVVVGGGVLAIVEVVSCVVSLVVEVGSVDVIVTDSNVVIPATGE